MSFPSLPLFVDDYEAATAHLSMEEDGCYSRLLRLCWRQPDCSIPADDGWIARRMRVDGEAYQRVVRPILAEFFTLSRGRWFQKRLREEHAYVRARSDARAEAGRKGGKAKAAKTKETNSSKATILPEQNGSKTVAPNPNPNPIEIEAEASIKARDARSHLAAVIGDDLAAAFVAHRKALRKPMTPRAGELMARKLGRIRDPVSAVETSIRRGWLDVFEDEKVHPFPKRQSDAERLDDHLDALKARLAVQRLE